MTNDITRVIGTEPLSKRFGPGPLALDQVTLNINEGEIVVLLGRSGSGKSTLLRHLDGLERPTTGNVVVLGRNVGQARERSLRSLRKRTGVIFQQFELVGPLTVLENALTGALGSLRGPRLGIWMYPKKLRERALAHLDRVGLLDKAYQRADTLSGGQQQRVAIARALMQEPEILLADEPVASLDPESSQQVMDLIREIAAERSLTVVCTLHQVDLALAWADRIVGLAHGSIVLDAPRESIDKARIMEIYGKVVASEVSEPGAITMELADMLSRPEAESVS